MATALRRVCVSRAAMGMPSPVLPTTRASGSHRLHAPQLACGCLLLLPPRALHPARTGHVRLRGEHCAHAAPLALCAVAEVVAREPRGLVLARERREVRLGRLAEAHVLALRLHAPQLARAWSPPLSLLYAPSPRTHAE